MVLIHFGDLSLLAPRVSQNQKLRNPFWLSHGIFVKSHLAKIRTDKKPPLKGRSAFSELGN
jgi:hypothetical protein